MKKNKFLIDLKYCEEKGKYAVEIDGVFSFYISPETSFKNNLHEYSEIDIEKLKEIKRSESLKSAKNEALKYLSYKKRTMKEVENKLENLGYTREIIEEAILKLQELDYIDDMDYSISYIKQSQKLNPVSSERIKYNLKSKGIPNRIIESALSEIDIDEYGDAKKLLSKKYKDIENMKDLKIKRKAIRFLKYRGYSDEIIKKCTGASF
jgi:regulatory protein